MAKFLWFSTKKDHNVRGVFWEAIVIRKSPRRPMSPTSNCWKPIGRRLAPRDSVGVVQGNTETFGRYSWELNWLNVELRATTFLIKAPSGTWYGFLVAVSIRMNFSLTQNIVVNENRLPLLGLDTVNWFLNCRQPKLPKASRTAIKPASLACIWRSVNPLMESFTQVIARPRKRRMDLGAKSIFLLKNITRKRLRKWLASRENWKLLTVQKLSGQFGHGLEKSHHGQSMRIRWTFQDGAR